MKKRIQIGMILAFTGLWAGAGILHADDRFLWRSWGVRDGLAETYSYAVSMTPGGSAYVRHGSVLSMSVLDGYSVTRIPDPRGSAQVDFPSTQEGVRRRQRCAMDHIPGRAPGVSRRKMDGAVYAARGSPGAGGGAGGTARDGAAGRRPSGVRPGSAAPARHPHGAEFQDCPFPDHVPGLRGRIVHYRRTRVGETAYFARRRCFRVGRSQRRRQPPHPLRSSVAGNRRVVRAGSIHQRQAACHRALVGNRTAIGVRG